MSLLNKLLLNLNLIHKKYISKKKYFSFSGVDVIIENIFRDKNDGFYIDIGCQHPIKNNNTYLLYKKGWIAPHWPEEHGGTGWNITQRYIWDQECANAGTTPLIPFESSISTTTRAPN